MCQECWEHFPYHCVVVIPTCIAACAVMHAGNANQWFPLKSVVGKRISASRRMHNLQFNVSGKRPMMRYELSAVNSKPDWCSNSVTVFNIINMWDHVIRTPIHNLTSVDLENIHLKSHCVMKYNTNCFWKYGCFPLWWLYLFTKSNNFCQHIIPALKIKIVKTIFGIFKTKL